MPDFKYNRPLLLIFFILNFFSAPLLAIEISVNPERNPVNLNESLQITFTANDEPDGEPDFSPLEKDFTILNRAQQQSTQIINWKKSTSYQWVLTVMAKQTGKLVIPAINFGSDSSPYSTLIVNDVQVSSKTNEDLFLQVEVNNTQPTIQEQLIYTLKLYRKVNITQANLTEPALKDAIIEKLGEDKNFNTQHQGENYIVTERKYAIFPQKSGTMTIAPLTMNANVVIASQRRNNSFFNRQSTRTVRITSSQITLDVQAKPVAANGKNWLPASWVYLEEKWPENSTQMTVGEPITRTITLYVEGATVAALPEIFQNNMPAHLKAYPDQPVLREEAKESGMVALREEKTALIPGQAGEYLLPAIKIPWWNTKTQTMEVARIPQRTITAVAAADSIQQPAGNTPSITVVSTPDSAEDKPRSELDSKQSLWFWLALFFACGWAGTVIYFWLNKARETKNWEQQQSAQRVYAVDKNLQLACTQNDPALAKDALLHWGREQFGQSSLSKIALQCDTDLQNEILALNTVLYSKTTQQWQGDALWSAFQNNQLTNIRKNDVIEPLQPLYKI